MIHEAQVIDALRSVMDPEIPTLSVVDLGMITGIAETDAGVRVRLLPTFVSCPATSVISANIKAQLERFGFGNVEVELDSEHSWSSDRITEHGRELLMAFGLGAPVQIEGVLNMDQIEHATCPHCGSTDTVMNSMFGSTLCRSIHFCNNCKQGFERFKPL